MTLKTRLLPTSWEQFEVGSLTIREKTEKNVWEKYELCWVILNTGRLVIDLKTRVRPTSSLGMYTFGFTPLYPRPLPGSQPHLLSDQPHRGPPALPPRRKKPLYPPGLPESQGCPGSRLHYGPGTKRVLRRGHPLGMPLTVGVVHTAGPREFPRGGSKREEGNLST